jgi:hypothetical protein
VAVGVLSELVHNSAVGILALGIMQIWAAMLVVIVALAYTGLALRIRHRGESKLPVFGFHGLSVLGNLMVRRIGPRYRGDRSHSTTTLPRPPRTKLGVVAHRVFWGPPRKTSDAI